MEGPPGVGLEASQDGLPPTALGVPVRRQMVAGQGQMLGQELRDPCFHPGPAI